MLSGVAWIFACVLLQEVTEDRILPHSFFLPTVDPFLIFHLILSSCISSIHVSFHKMSVENVLFPDLSQACRTDI